MVKIQYLILKDIENFKRYRILQKQKMKILIILFFVQIYYVYSAYIGNLFTSDNDKSNDEITETLTL